MSEPLPPAAPDGPQPEPLDDAALTSLLTALPRTPAPAGFRDAVLAAIAADDVDAEERSADTPGLDEAAEGPSPQIAPAAAPTPPPRWRRAAGVLAGLAMTAAALSGVAVLWSWSTEDRAVDVAVRDSAAVNAPASRWMGESEGELSFAPAPASAPLMEAAPAHLADEELAESIKADWDAGGGIAPDAADALAVAPAPRALTEDVGTDGADFSAVRVLRVQTPSELSNQLAVLQFERTALRNAIPPRLAELESGLEGMIDQTATARSAPAESEGSAGAAAGAPAGGSLADRPQSGPVGVLVMAEPDRFEATLREFRTDLALNAATAGATIADAGPLPRGAAGKLLEQAEPNRDAALQFEATLSATGSPSAASNLEMEAPTAARPLGNAMGGLGGGAQPADGEAFEGDAFHGGVRGPGQAGDAPFREGESLSRNAPYQLRIAPPTAEAFSRSQDPAAKGSRPQSAPSEPGESDDARPPSEMQRRGLDALELRTLARRRGNDARVPVLLLFEPPPEPAAESAAEPPR
ncbi:hypothetical protein [Alienimonas californiensis]|uniref:Uncharacterized protein n=1 Tax=Alienimonas californiensis TaxID=2527989 RepID=A0A517PET8_9PLAN|nr:hypothetical protein [Alienimonas californiensis]QDT17890.1 hypothetical protein CA12_40260 [Alienimonas californiensis]